MSAKKPEPIHLGMLNPLLAADNVPEVVAEIANAGTHAVNGTLSLDNSREGIVWVLNLIQTTLRFVGEHPDYRHLRVVLVEQHEGDAAP